MITREESGPTEVTSTWFKAELVVTLFEYELMPAPTMLSAKMNMAMPRLIRTASGLNLDRESRTDLAANTLDLFKEQLLHGKLAVGHLLEDIVMGGDQDTAATVGARPHGVQDGFSICPVKTRTWFVRQE